MRIVFFSIVPKNRSFDPALTKTLPYKVYLVVETELGKVVLHLVHLGNGGQTAGAHRRRRELHRLRRELLSGTRD